jgi:hypothetical protein
MNRTIERLKLVFLGLFALSAAGVFAYHSLVVWPGEACEKGGKWWDPKHRVCATPVLISDITGRPIKDVHAERAAAMAQSADEPQVVAP